MTSEITEDVQELVDLTPDQDKAFKSLVRAINKCRKANVYFYQALDDLGALNGNNVKSVHCDDDALLTSVPEHIFDESRNLNGSVSFPLVKTTDAFADDCHYIRLHSD